jgi:hypothetical protein
VKLMRKAMLRIECSVQYEQQQAKLAVRHACRSPLALDLAALKVLHRGLRAATTNINVLNSLS